MVCSAWPCVEAVSLGEFCDEDILDPYFVLSFDIYHTGDLPGPEARAQAFEGAGAFESSRIQAKDRFFLEGLPVRVEYKLLAEVEELAVIGRGGRGGILGVGTYPLHRLATARLIHDRSGWFPKTRARLAELSEETWAALAEVHEAKLEHYLADLGASARMDDPYFFLESASGFARNAVALLFVANRVYEPSHRSLDARLKTLPRLPDDFVGRWEILLRSDIEISREQKFEVASLIAKSILAMR
jgi:hypothetical protein